MAKGSKSQRRAQSAAAERAAALRKEAERKERRKRSALIGAVAVVVLVLVGGVAALVISNQDGSAPAAGTAPAGAVATTGGPEDAQAGRLAVPWGEAAAPVEVVVYEDFLCPFCRNFEAASTPILSDYVADGDVEVQFRPLNFLSRAGEYSGLAANAYAVVLDAEGPEVAKEFHDQLFANQPSESGPFPDESDLVDLAVSAGADRDAVESGIEGGAFEDWVADGTEAAQDEGVSGTPTVYVDGEEIDAASEADLIAQLQQRIEAGLQG
ncbi:DsbA family protein [Nocardioidaceae bacterium]|nr:DsbA family protein [Nocardioidaceae bacterium]